MTSTTKNQRVIFVTGANKGLGFEVVKKLVKESSSSNDTLILLGSRDLKRGEDAIKQLGSPSNVHLIQIDTSSPASIKQAADLIKQKYGGKLDVLVNNAGIASREVTVEVAKQVLDTNYYGIKITNEHFVPLMKENGRIVNVASEVGAWALHEMSNDLQNKFKSSSLTTEQLDKILEEFVSAIKSNSLEKLGYNTKSLFLIYGVSKAALIALTRVEARQWSKEKNLLVVSVCPGYCATDLNHHSGPRDPQVGADSILYPVNASRNQLENGEFYQDGEKKPQSYACNMQF